MPLATSSLNMLAYELDMQWLIKFCMQYQNGSSDGTEERENSSINMFSEGVNLK